MASIEESLKSTVNSMIEKFSGGRTCEINTGGKSYDPESGDVDVTNNKTTVPYCTYGITQKFFRNQDFAKASLVLAVSGHHFSYNGDAVFVGGSVTLPNGAVKRIIAKNVDGYGILFELGLS